MKRSLNFSARWLLLITFVVGQTCIVQSWLAPASGYADETAATEKSREEKSPEDAAADKAAEKTPATVTAKQDELLVVVDVEGVFEAVNVAEIVLQPKKLSSMKVSSVVAHGTIVNEGDVLLVMETEDVDEEIETLERSLANSELGLKLAMEELRFLKESTAMDLEQVDRSAKEAAEDLQYYETVKAERDLKAAELNLKMAEFRLEYAEEELKQLTQMYEADDLTEQTEEIILKRTSRDVEMAKFSLEEAKLNYTRQIEVLFPRQKQSNVDGQSRAAMNRAKSFATLPMVLKKKQLDVEQLQSDLTEKKEKLAELKQDRDAMTVLAPMTGIVYYGKASGGKWTEVAVREKAFFPGAPLPANQTLLTIVDPSEMRIAVAVSEAVLATIARNQPAIVRPVAMKNSTLIGLVSEVTPVVQGDGKFPVTVSLSNMPAGMPLTPGMTANVTVKVYENPEAILVPKKAVFAEEFAVDKTHYVWLAGGEGKPTKKYVKTGFSKNLNIEILSGLTAGAEILQEAPE